MGQPRLSHQERIYEELRAAGVTKYGMRKFAIRYLPKILHENEHVKGIVYGRYRDKTGSISLNEGLLVATESRVVFLDHKPGFTDTEELSYNVISGITRTSAVFTAVNLRSKVGDFIIRFVNPNCAEKFVSYVEQRQLESMKDQINIR